MATIPAIPSVNTPTYQSWGAAVANAINAKQIFEATGLAGNRAGTTNLATVTIPAATFDRLARINVHILLSTVTAGNFDVRLYISGSTLLGRAQQSGPGSNTFSITREVPLTANVTYPVRMEVNVTTGTAASYADPTINLLQAVIE